MTVRGPYMEAHKFMMYTVALYREEMNQVGLHRNYPHVTVRRKPRIIAVCPYFLVFVYLDLNTLLQTPGDGALALVSTALGVLKNKEHILW